MKKSLSCAHVLCKTLNVSFHVVVLPMTAKKCTKTCNAHAERLLLLIKPCVLWRSSCRRSRRCLSSVLIRGRGRGTELLMYHCSSGICRSTKSFLTVLSNIVRFNKTRNGHRKMKSWILQMIQVCFRVR